MCAMQTSALRRSITLSEPTHLHTLEEERAIREAALDRTIEGSFPASDPLSTAPNPYDRYALVGERRERISTRKRVTSDTEAL